MKMPYRKKFLKLKSLFGGILLVKQSLHIGTLNEPTIINQLKFNASSLYEWNINGMSEYNILTLYNK
jgi:hypothetical protein